MIGSPSIQHKPPEPGYIDVIQSITKLNPYITRCGRVGKTWSDAEAVGGAKVFLCPPI